MYPTHLWVWWTLKGKNLLLRANSLLNEMTPIYVGGNNENDSCSPLKLNHFTSKWTYTAKEHHFNMYLQSDLP